MIGRVGATRRHRAGLAASLAALACALALPAFAAARPGALDQGFGAHGRVTTAIDQVVPWNRVNTHVAEAPDGSVVVAGNQKIARYKPDGRLDTSFGNGGFATVGYPAGLTFELSDLEVDSAGQPILIGTGNVGNISVPFYGGVFHPTVAMIVRLHANGAPDTQFGKDGVVWTDFDIPSPSGLFEGHPNVEIAAGAVDSAGRIVVAVGTRALRGRCSFRSQLERVDSWIMRLGLNGELDPSFGGGDGVAELAGIERVADLVLDPSDRPVLTASVPVPCEQGPLTVFFRQTSEGILDPSYGANLAIPPPDAIGLDRLGRLVTMGRQGPPGSTERVETPFWRLTPNGKRDNSFGRRGRTAVSLPGTRYDYESQGLGAFALDRRGRILTAGTFGVVVKKKGPIYKRTRGRFSVVRLASSGKVDRRFGKRGWVITRFGRRSDAVAKTAVVDRVGRLVVAGTATRPNLEPTGGFALARYLTR